MPTDRLHVTWPLVSPSVRDRLLSRLRRAPRPMSPAYPSSIRAPARSRPGARARSRPISTGCLRAIRTPPTPGDSRVRGALTPAFAAGYAVSGFAPAAGDGHRSGSLVLRRSLVSGTPSSSLDSAEDRLGRRSPPRPVASARAVRDRLRHLPGRPDRDRPAPDRGGSKGGAKRRQTRLSPAKPIAERSKRSGATWRPPCPAGTHAIAGRSSSPRRPGRGRSGRESRPRHRPARPARPGPWAARLGAPRRALQAIADHLPGRQHGRAGAMAAAAVRHVEAGFRTVKLKVGDARQPARDAARIGAVRAAVGPAIGIKVDVNQGWRTPGIAIAAIRASPSECSGLHRAAGRPVGSRGIGRGPPADRGDIMADEACHGPREMMRIAALRAADLVNIKLMKTRRIGKGTRTQRDRRDGRHRCASGHDGRKLDRLGSRAASGDGSRQCPHRRDGRPADGDRRYRRRRRLVRPRPDHRSRRARPRRSRSTRRQSRGLPRRAGR